MHAARQFADQHKDREALWFEESNTIAFLSVPDERGLVELEIAASLRGFPVSRFEEPDLGMRITAVALAPEARRLCARLPKALMA